MEFSFLYAISRTEVLDSFFLGLTRVAGSYAEVTKDMKTRAVKSLEDYLNEDD